MSRYRWLRKRREHERERKARLEEERRHERHALIDRRWNEGGDPLRQAEVAAEDILTALEDHENGRITDEEFDEIVERCNELHEKWLAGELVDRDEEVMHDGS